MSFVESKCPHCSAVLPVDDSRDVWICSYCNKPFITAKAIAEYNSSENKKSAVPETVKSIDYLDLSGCENLHELTITAENIGNLDFSECTGLQSITINAGSIESLDFSDCPNLQIINLPKTVKIETVDVADCKKAKPVSKKNIPEKNS
ncbi:MAG: leucine-rich repeat domain-containing protein [Ruminococcus flavefaciens]|nr:leucine-rich repeat domain-containing protein [Ruminococcus flavefaciens]MCM1228600.1 leucine-rich repeat domain-containing protein [Ruminococcus flavefaciens]